MENIKRSLALKVAAYIIMVVCAGLTVLASIVAIINIDYEWYSKSKKTASQDIYRETAFYGGRILANKIIEGDSSKGYFYLTDEELLEGENSSTEFGYVITVYDGAEFGLNPADDGTAIIRQCNQQLKNTESTYTQRLEHDAFKIDVFLGDMDSDTGVPTEISSVYNRFNDIYNYRNIALATAIIGFIAAICIFIFLATTVGRRRPEDGGNNEPEGKQSFIKRLPMDVIVAAAVFISMFVGYSSDGISLYDNYDVAIAAIIITTVALVVLVSGFLLLFICKVRMGRWWESALIYKLLMIFKWMALKVVRLLENVHLVWKTALILLVGLLINLFIILLYGAGYGGSNGGALLLWFVGAVVTAAAVFYTALGMRKLKDGGKRLAEGELDYKIDKKGLFLDFAEHADNLNSIGQGISKAVSEKMKSERFKTELITNVSHDIKTPLTSIINYVDFLKDEDISGEKSKEYIEVLDRQSQRLKKLTEDLVEASKAATGNVKMNMEPCKIGMLMTQSMVEYEEKAQEADINLVMKLPDDEIKIFADGRSMWRVFDNLLNNICKYTQPETRVYQTLEKRGGKAIIIYKNVSKYELNITGDELTERFVRGDSSRHTDGSGLGLSIAQNLIELQGGKFHIDVDGDLFKITMEFDLRDEEEQS
ncbi:MAG: hypothetical protein GX663_09685 [Clostridiales bacterium]|nr:hypothetical protein [Clostridiales bacterium]